MSFPKKLVAETDPVLTTVATPVDIKDLKLLSTLATGMERVLKRTDTGIGLALPQVGISLRGFHLASSLFNNPSRHRFCFNPTITQFSEAQSSGPEGCLSLPGRSFIVFRHNYITVAYTNEKGRQVTEELFGMASKAFQHELDHLDGVLISHKTRSLKATDLELI